MTNEWRIAGGLGIQPDPRDPDQVVMTQGLGFPLRPVDNVPNTDTPTIPDGLVAEGQFMQWMGDWVAGLYYTKGSFVRAGLWSSVANTLSLEPPAPIPDPADPATFGIPTYTPATQSNASVVFGGQTYTFSQDGWIKKLRVWVTELLSTTNYRIILVDETDPANPVSRVIEEPVLVENNWIVISLLNQVVKSGTILKIYIDALNSAAETNVSGGWTAGAISQSGAPLTQSWNQTQQQDIFRIDKTDLDGTDRGTELEGVIEGSSISLVQTNNVANNTLYRVVSALDQTTYMEYGVTLQTQAGGGPDVGSTTTVDIDIPVPSLTEYAQEIDTWLVLPSWASSVVGFVEFNGVAEAGVADNGYGVDIEFEPAQVSTEWDIVSYSG